ncbi:histone deacetylase 10 isoform X2 [Iris pallida]|uniref:Histone deacetylase 10 isoform X2 n=1 Tax=Iris pallida TaxID=29817 RepID=A0AAX6EDL2_IRIPA|nr:histone deacetylase 10 isoform X2 [Iris pallida]
MHLTALGSSFPTDGPLSFTKHTHPNTFSGSIPLLLPCNISHGDFHPRTFEGILLIS